MTRHSRTDDRNRDKLMSKMKPMMTHYRIGSFCWFRDNSASLRSRELRQRCFEDVILAISGLSGGGGLQYSMARTCESASAQTFH